MTGRSVEHVWSCGRCGQRVVATVGAIARTFKAHLLACPALARRRARSGRQSPSTAPRAAGQSERDAPAEASPVTTTEDVADRRPMRLARRR